MASKDIVKILLYKRAMTITSLAQKMTELTAKNYTRAALSSKLARSAIRYDEMELIAKILGYEIEFKDVAK